MTEVDFIVGCALLAIPVWVTLRPSWTARELLHHIQQQLRSIPYRYVDFNEIRKQSTSWAGETCSDGLLAIDSWSHTLRMTIDGVRAPLQPVYVPRDSRDVHVMSAIGADPRVLTGRGTSG
jgi:hypothetical protein